MQTFAQFIQALQAKAAVNDIDAPPTVAEQNAFCRSTKRMFAMKGTNGKSRKAKSDNR